METESVKALVSGSFGGACASLAGHPLDTIKIRLQMVPRHRLHEGFAECFVRTVREDTALSLYSGVSPALVSSVVENSVAFAANSFLQRQAKSFKARRSGDEEANGLELHELAAIGGLSGVLSAAAICPLDMAKCRMQAQMKSKAAEPPRYTSSTDCLGQTLRSEGVRGLFRGLPAQLARDVPFMFAFFGTYEALCKGICVLRNVRDKKDLRGPEIVLAGGLAGIAGWSLTIPMDVVKSHIQIHDRRVTDVVRHILQSKGPAGFFNGLSAATLRSFPFNGALFLGYEFANSKIDDILRSSSNSSIDI